MKVFDKSGRRKRMHLILACLWGLTATLTGLLAIRSGISGGSDWRMYAILAGLQILVALLWLVSWMNYDRRHGSKSR